jgi:putative aldouronate transport system substrate-binding protein
LKKKLALATSFTLCAVAILGGCTQSPTEVKKKESSSAPALGAFPLEKPITLKVFLPSDPSIEDLKTNELTKEYEAKTNVHIEWIEVSSKDMEQKRNLLLATNSDMPDIFLNTKISNAQQVQFGSQGVLLPLNDLIEKYGVNIKKVFDYKPLIKKMVTAPDGNIYALPSVEETFHTSLGQKLWINQAWLTKLGLKMPQTTDEFYEVLKAFKEKDPNGNGKADEIPLTGAINGYNTNVYSFIMNAFIQNQGFDEGPFILDNGKVSVAFDKPQWQEGLKYLNKLFKEGLLDRGAISQDGIQLKQLAASKDVLLGSVSAGAMTGFLAADSPRMKEYTSVPPLKGPQGVQTTGYYPNQLTPGKFAISSSSKYPDIALRWVDWFYSQEGTLRSNAGREGIEWRRGKPEEIGLNGKPALFFRMLKFGKTQNVHWNKNVPILYTEILRNGSVVEPTDQETILYNETKTKYEPYKPKEVLPPLFMTSEESEEYLGIDFSIRDYILQSTAKFVVGDMNVDKDWPVYLQQLDKIGLKKYVALTQGAYDRSYKK